MVLVNIIFYGFRFEALVSCVRARQHISYENGETHKTATTKNKKARMNCKSSITNSQSTSNRNDEKWARLGPNDYVGSYVSIRPCRTFFVVFCVRHLRKESAKHVNILCHDTWDWDTMKISWSTHSIAKWRGIYYDFLNANRERKRETNTTKNRNIRDNLFARKTFTLCLCYFSIALVLSHHFIDTQAAVRWKWRWNNKSTAFQYFITFLFILRVLWSCSTLILIHSYLYSFREWSKIVES